MKPEEFQLAAATAARIRDHLPAIESALATAIASADVVLATTADPVRRAAWLADRDKWAAAATEVIAAFHITPNVRVPDREL